MINTAMTDDELLEQFEDAALEWFHHADHVRVAFLYLSRYPVLQALEMFSEGLKQFAAARGKQGLYHATITWAYVLLIQERMARAGRVLSWEEFARENADHLQWMGGILGRYYTEERLASDLARAVFVFPDRIL